MLDRILLYIGGGLNVAGLLFHLMFWRIFHWNEELGRLSIVNGKIMQLLNISAICVFGMFAWLSFVHTNELLKKGMGASLLGWIAGFFVVRLVAGIALGERAPLLFLVLVLYAACYAVPFMRVLSRKQEPLRPGSGPV